MVPAIGSLKAAVALAGLNCIVCLASLAITGMCDSMFARREERIREMLTCLQRGKTRIRSLDRIARRREIL